MDYIWPIMLDHKAVHSSLFIALLLLVDAVVVSFCICVFGKLPLRTKKKNLRKQKVNKLNFVVSVFKSCSGLGRIMDANETGVGWRIYNITSFMVLFAFHFGFTIFC